MTLCGSNASEREAFSIASRAVFSRMFRRSLLPWSRRCHELIYHCRTQGFGEKSAKKQARRPSGQSETTLGEVERASEVSWPWPADCVSSRWPTLRWRGVAARSKRICASLPRRLGWPKTSGPNAQGVGRGDPNGPPSSRSGVPSADLRTKVREAREASARPPSPVREGRAQASPSPTSASCLRLPDRASAVMTGFAVDATEPCPRWLSVPPDVRLVLPSRPRFLRYTPRLHSWSCAGISATATLQAA